MKDKTEFEKFDAVMGGLLAVPRAELNKQLAAAQRAKEKKKRSKTASSSRVSRAVSSRKGRAT